MNKITQWIIYTIVMIIVCVLLALTDNLNLPAYYGGLIVGTIFGFIAGGEKQ